MKIQRRRESLTIFVVFSSLFFMPRRLGKNKSGANVYPDRLMVRVTFIFQFQGTPSPAPYAGFGPALL